MAKRILTVDDSTSLREMISFVIREAGYDVIEAKEKSKSHRSSWDVNNGSSIVEVAERSGPSPR